MGLYQTKILLHSIGKPQQNENAAYEMEKISVNHIADKD